MYAVLLRKCTTRVQYMEPRWKGSKKQRAARSASDTEGGVNVTDKGEDGQFH